MDADCVHAGSAQKGRLALAWTLFAIVCMTPVATAERGLGGDIIVTPDITFLHFGEPLADEDATAPGDPSSRLEFGLLPPSLEVTGFHLDQDEQLVYFSVDQVVTLGGVTGTPQDVFVTDGEDYELFYKGANEGVPMWVKIDAVALIGEELFLSFDTSFVINDAIADEDLVWASNNHAILFKGTASGVPAGLDLDGAHVFDEGVFALSFDATGKLGELIADDDDVVLFEGGEFSAVLYEGGAVDAAWQAGDVNGLSFGVPVPPTGLIFQDGFESGNTTAWN